MDKVNFQNLPSRDKKKKALKNSVVAPDGYVVINCDSSQIEASGWQDRMMLSSSFARAKMFTQYLQPKYMIAPSVKQTQSNDS
jgi:hypothetical protein